LRSQNRDTLIPWFSYLKLFLTALYKLPSFKGTIWRGVSGNISDQYDEDQIWWGASSCTETMNVMEGFVGLDGVRTLFNIECINGKAIRSHSYYKTENEILLMPGTYLQIVSKWSPAKDLYIIHLRETAAPYQTIAPPCDPPSPLIDMPSLTTPAISKEKKSLSSGYVASAQSHGPQLQGIETRYINGNNGNETTNTSAFDRSTKALVNQFFECDWLYENIRRIINSPTTGLVSQAVVANLSSELREYHRLVSVIEQQLGNAFDPAGSVSLEKLHVWLSTPMQRLKSIASISEHQGGALLSLLYTHQQHGDSLQQSTVYPLLYKCTIPIRDMIVEWICNGIINDPYQEFFVSVDKKIDDENLWYEKYSLRTSMIPSFLTDEQAEKIWITGKSINFLRVLCKDRTVLQVVDIPASPETLFQQQSSTEFHDMIISAYNETTRHLRLILDEKYHMMDHFKAIKRYLLLGQGDFIKYLTDLMEVELNKPANQVLYHNLQPLMDSAIRVTNAQFEKEDIIKRLDLRLMYVSASELGWDVCCLDYKLGGPLKTIFTEDNTLRFMRIFNHLWRVKRVEYTTCGVWKQLIKNSRRFSSIPEIIYLMHTCFGISNEMTHFIQSINYYIMFEILECSWSDLLSKLKDAKDLQQILEANNESLEKIIIRLLLDADEKSQDLAKQLRCIFDLILNFDTLTQKLFLTVDNELEARLSYQQQRQYEDKDAELRRFHHVFKPALKTIKCEIQILKKTFRDAVLKFLQQLKTHPDITLRCLSFRLNFNEFYKVS
ncbi:unnamed protein product, partial [Didymodactylos carnosus]